MLYECIIRCYVVIRMAFIHRNEVSCIVGGNAFYFRSIWRHLVSGVEISPQRVLWRTHSFPNAETATGTRHSARRADG